MENLLYELLSKVSAAEGLQDNEKTRRPTAPQPVTAVQELAFTVLKWEEQQGTKNRSVRDR